jgi:GH35 family endo-1,4-beta-xylanase
MQASHLVALARACLRWSTVFSLIIFANQQICSAKSTLLSEKPKVVQVSADNEPKILKDSKKRIDQYRKADAMIQIVNGAGFPVPGAQVYIEQTNHEFLFGCSRSISTLNNIFSKKYGVELRPIKKNRPKHLRKEVIDNYIDIYDQRFLDFANYTFLPTPWHLYEPKPGSINYRLWDQEIQWLKENRFKIRGGHLVWNIGTPSWVPERCPELIAAVEKRIKDYVSLYSGKIDHFIVINEATHPFRPAFAKDKITRCYRDVGQVEFVSLALKAARKANPTAKIVINETGILNKGNAFAKLLNDLIDSHGKKLYDVIGIQSHMHRRLWPLDRVWDGLEFFSSFGVPIHFTELTILSGSPIAGKNFGMQTTAEGEHQQADYAVKLYTLLFSHPAVESIMWWNLSDLLAYRKAPGGLLRKDMSPKPAYNALRDLIWKKWRTKVQTKTSDRGECQYRGFFGDYQVTVITESGESKSFEIKLSKEGKRKFKLTL